MALGGGFCRAQDVAKTLVYELSRWRNTVSEVIPERIITRAPSAELRPDQKDRTACRNTRCWTPSANAMSRQTARRKDEIIAEGFPRRMCAKWCAC